MYRHILVPTDGSKLSLKAAKVAAQLAAALKARITTIYVIAPYLPAMEAEGLAFYGAYTAREYEKSMRKTGDQAHAKVKAVAGAARVKSEALTVVQGNPWEAIIKAAREKKCDLIVMASHGRRGLQGLLLGSETQKVLTHSKTPVLVCR
jgi:nucleotide-binding universal stress UspA family protein